MDTESKLTVGEAIRASAKFERVAADFYLLLQKGFAYLPEVAAFWGEMRAEELEHAALVDQVYAALSSAEVAETAPEELSEGIESVQKLIDLTVAYPLKNLDEAYSLAYQLEFSEVNAILKLIVTQIAPREKFKSLNLSTLDDHRNKLHQLTPKFGDRAWRREQRLQS